MTDKTQVLLLGGTAEARELAGALHDHHIDVISSLAGRVSKPRLPVGEVRIGGFGGVHGLVTFLRGEAVTHVVDATHPFAVGMRTNAMRATTALGLPMCRLARPGWAQRPEAASWHWVAGYEEADEVVALLGERPFITSGRQTLPYFERVRELPALVRVVEPLDPGVASGSWTVMLDRGPFGVEEEIQLMREHRSDVLVTKDSGGRYTAAKLDAAREVGVPVVIVARPAAPTGLREWTGVPDVVAWLGVEPV